MFGTAYDRQIANEIHRINQRFIDREDRREISDELIPSYEMLGRGKVGRPAKLFRNAEMIHEEPIINVSGKGYLDSLRKHVKIQAKELKDVAVSHIKEKVRRKAHNMVDKVMPKGRGRPKKGKGITGGEIVGGEMGDYGFHETYEGLGITGGKKHMKKGKGITGGEMGNYGYHETYEGLGIIGGKKHMKKGKGITGGENDFESMYGSGVRKYKKKGEFMDFLEKNVKRKGKGMTGGEIVGGARKISPKERGKMVSEYMKAHNVKLGEASKAISAYLKGDHKKLSGGAFKWLKHFFEGVPHAIETVGKDVYGVVKTGAETIAKAPELLGAVL
jgi:hypothetical protein